jgi:hypothetical protein
MVLLVVGSYRTVRTTECVYEFQGTILWEGRTTVHTWHGLRGIFLGQFLVCCKWISLAGNCDFAADMYFP